MKKFLLSLFTVVFSMVTYSQTIPCPISFKRNNGNNCVAYGRGGSISFKFTVAPPANLQVHTIVLNTNSGPVLTRLVQSSRSVSNNGTEVEWCFENSNIPPASQVTFYQPTFYLDANLNQKFDVGESQRLCGGSEGSLPVTFKKFDAEKRTNKVVLSWETATEMDNSGFEIERKNDAGNFEKIGFVATKAPSGTGAGYSYSFEDNSPSKGRVLYRIRQVDFSGSFLYSDVKAILMGNGTVKILAYPNPSKGNFNVVLPAGMGKSDVRLEAMTGELIQSWNNYGSDKISVSNLNKGFYLLRGKVLQTGETFVERIIVQ